jgi:predicted nucleic acid-binding protein
VIYLDTSVVLAELLAEDRHPAARFWDAAPFVSSRLLALGLGDSHGDDVRQLLAGIGFLELSRPVLARATEPFPAPVRTLDALHLASLAYLVGLGQRPRLATYDSRLADAARALEIPLAQV